jgi:hypothetical protein
LFFVVTEEVADGIYSSIYSSIYLSLITLLTLLEEATRNTLLIDAAWGKIPSDKLRFNEENKLNDKKFFPIFMISPKSK